MIRCHENYDLTPHNSFGVAARAARVVEFDTAASLAQYLSSEGGAPQGKWAVLGGGNNILFTRDYPGTLFHPASSTITITAQSEYSVTVRVSAGQDWDGFTEWCAEQGLWGVENLAGIPGHTGAAPVQNIGAYGAEVKDTVESVEVLHMQTLKTTTIACGHCGFAYRDSIFKHALKGKVIITSVNFRLSRLPRPNTSYGALHEEAARLGDQTPANIRRAVLNIREGKLPDPARTGNAGSFFKNPVVDLSTAAALRKRYPGMPQYPDAGGSRVKLAAGWLIEQAGWRGRSEGNVGVYDRQALIIVNHGGATGLQVVEFSEKVRASVRDKFGITIEPEVNIW